MEDGWNCAIPPGELASSRRSVPSVNDLNDTLRDAVRGYNSDGFACIHSHFDTFLGVIINESRLDWATINKGFDYVGRSCQQFTVHLETLFKNRDIEANSRVKALNELKMLLYLLTGFIKAKDSKLGIEKSASLNIGKRGRKANANDEQAAESEWRESDRRGALEIIYNLLQLNLQRLWDPPLADDSFVDMVARPCYDMMEDPIIKSKTTRETVFQILGILNKKYNHGMSCTIKLVQMVQLYEHAVPAICAGFNQLVTVWGLNGMISRLVRELGDSLGGNEGDDAAANDSAPAQRNCALFLSELTQLMPAQMIPAAQAMRPHLEIDESYPLRSSILGMLCEILCKELKGEGLSSEKRTLRDEFLDDLEEHLHDMSAFVRARVLQCWGRLQREGCIPVLRQQRVLGRAVGRLQDRTSLVRKNAIQVVKSFLEHNPFSAQLKLSQVEEQLSNEMKLLDELKNKINSVMDVESIEKWASIESEVKDAIEQNLSAISQDDASTDGNEDMSHSTVKKSLLDKRYSDAIMYIKFTEKQYPAAKTMRCEMSDEDQVSYILNTLKMVFVTSVQGNRSESQNLGNVDVIKQIEEKENLCAFLEDCVAFSKLIQQAIPLIYSLLMSKQITDVTEAIDFFITAHQFNIETSKLGTMGMLQLVWSPDQEKRDVVDRAYREMYLNKEGNSERNQAAATAKALVKLVQSVNRGQAAALQVLLIRWFKAEDLNNTILQIFWEMFTSKHESTSEDDSYAALSLLVMVSKAKASIASANIDIIRTIGLAGPYRVRVQSAQLLLSMAQNRQRFPMDNPIFTTLHESLLDTFYKSKKFAGFAENAVNVIYELCDTPDLLCLKILTDISDKLSLKIKDEPDEDSKSYPIEYVSRLIVILGHIALRQLIFLDITVYSEFRRRNEVREERKQAGAKNKIQLSTGKKTKKKGPNELNSSSASAASRRLQNQSLASLRNEEEPDEGLEEGLEGAVADDADAEMLRAICEKDVVCSGLLSRAIPILRSLLQSANLSPELYASACLTLGRFMMVSSVFCEDNMQLYMSLLKNASSSITRCNIVITLSDLTLRFPNVIQPWTHYIYERLEDDCVEVRQCTVKMLSYLILHEMVRVRGQVAGLAKCCVDPDPNTRTMARLFFKQLSQKGNSLYNIMPDIISRLSDPSIEMPENDFRTILKYVMGLIQKDRQMEALVEKLCLRFKLSTNERQWRDLAYCLSLFNYNERSIKKLIEHLDCYKDKLFTKEVYDCFKTIINNTNKLAKADLKTTVSELSDKIEENFSITENNDENNESEAPKRKPVGTPRGKKNQGRRQRPAKSSSDESDDSDTENVTPRKTKNARAPANKRTPLRARNADMDDFIEPDQVFKKPAARVIRKRK